VRISGKLVQTRHGSFYPNSTKHNTWVIPPQFNQSRKIPWALFQILLKIAPNVPLWVQ